MLPKKLLGLYRAMWRRYFQYRELRLTPRSARKLLKLSKHTDYANTRLDAQAEAARELVLQSARQIYGDDYDYYSGALSREIVKGFESSILALVGARQSIDYLEIGSCQGVSMALIGSLLRNKGVLGRLVSIDPYFEDGYAEGDHGPYGNKLQVQSNKRTKESAYALYKIVGLEVEHLETTSAVGMTQLLAAGAMFDLVYIDGSHERFWPTIDFALGALLLRNKGVLILDDHLWQDVEVIKRLCDKHGTIVQETWKTASYQIDL